MAVKAFGIDHDSPEPNGVVERLVGHATRVESIQRRRSPTGNLHYLITMKELISAEAAFQLREYLGDDSSRIAVDRRRHAAGQTFDVLYERKGGCVAGDWENLTRIV